MGTVYLAQNKTFKLYAIVSQYLFMILFLTVGGYLLGKYVVFKTPLFGGVFATVGALVGIIMFIIQLINIGKEYEKQRD